jgi:hypothetical protein
MVKCAGFLNNQWEPGTEQDQGCRTDPEFVNPLRSQGIDSQPGRIDTLESIPGLLKHLQIWAPTRQTT